MGKSSSSLSFVVGTSNVCVCRCNFCPKKRPFFVQLFLKFHLCFVSVCVCVGVFFCIESCYYRLLVFLIILVFSTTPATTTPATTTRTTTCTFFNNSRFFHYYYYYLYFLIILAFSTKWSTCILIILAFSTKWSHRRWWAFSPLIRVTPTLLLASTSNHAVDAIRKISIVSHHLIRAPSFLGAHHNACSEQEWDNHRQGEKDVVGEYWHRLLLMLMHQCHGRSFSFPC